MVVSRRQAVNPGLAKEPLQRPVIQADDVAGVCPGVLLRVVHVIRRRIGQPADVDPDLSGLQLGEGGPEEVLLEDQLLSDRLGRQTGEAEHRQGDGLAAMIVHRNDDARVLALLDPGARDPFPLFVQVMQARHGPVHLPEGVAESPKQLGVFWSVSR